MIIEWKNLGSKIQFTDPNSLGLTYLTRVRLGLSHLPDHKFCHNFRDLVSLTFGSGEVTETAKHYPLHCSNFIRKKQSLMQIIEKINPNFLSMNENSLTVLLF